MPYIYTKLLSTSSLSSSNLRYVYMPQSPLSDRRILAQKDHDPQACVCRASELGSPRNQALYKFIIFSIFQF